MNMRVLVIDNYDSFTYNLVQYLGELGAEPEVVRNDQAEVGDLLERGPERLVISPGPCTPADAGISIEAARAFPEAGVPTLGVCLGHQSMVEAFGGRTIRGEPAHGPGQAHQLGDGLPLGAQGNEEGSGLHVGGAALHDLVEDRRGMVGGQMRAGAHLVDGACEDLVGH